MHEQVDFIDAQLNKRPDGSIEILGQHSMIVLTGECATRIKARYDEFFAAYPTREGLKISINIEIPQPLGQIVNEN